MSISNSIYFEIFSYPALQKKIIQQYIKKNHGCSVYGIEPSKKACKFAKKFFSLKIENNTFLKSNFFNFEKKNYQKLDVIIFDDIISYFWT